MAFAGIERHERSGLAFDGLTGSIDRDAAVDHLDDCTLTHVMVAQLFSGAQVEGDEPALG
jgi:hypothetical protein